MASARRPQLDKVIHERVRLSMLAYLASSSALSVSFTELKEELELTAGNLSIQLRNLEEAGYVEITKRFVDNKSNTAVRITTKGARALTDYLSELEALIQPLKQALKSDEEEVHHGNHTEA